MILLNADLLSQKRDDMKNTIIIDAAAMIRCLLDKLLSKAIPEKPRRETVMRSANLSMATETAPLLSGILSFTKSGRDRSPSLAGVKSDKSTPATNTWKATASGREQPN